MQLDTKLSTRITVGLILLLAASALAMWQLEHSRQRDAYVAERAADLDKFVQAESLRLKQQIEVLRRDVLFLSNTPPVSGIVRATQNGGIDPRDRDSMDKWKRRLTQIFSAFSQAHPDYYRIRYIAIENGGRPIVDVDSRNTVNGTEHDERYGMRDFMRHALALPEGRVYLSEIEYPQFGQGPGRVQTLRAATPIYDSAGKPFGLVVVNLDMEPLMNMARAGVSGDVEVYIADMAGRYLLHPDAALVGEAGPPGERTLPHDFPLLAPVFRPDEVGNGSEPLTPLADDGQMFEAMQLHFDPENPQRFLVLGYRIANVFAGMPSSMTLARHLFGGLIGMLLVGAISMRLLRRTFQPLEQLAIAAERIGAGERDVELPRGGVAEIGRLTRATGAMLDALMQREQLILKSNEELERRVDERTRELSFSNELLQSAVDEARRRQQEAAIELHRNQALMATSMDGIHVMDIDGKLVEANDAFCRMLGYERDEAMKLNVADWDVQWSREELRDRFNYLIGRSELFETKHRRKDGTVIDVEISTSGVELDGKSLLFASSRDITARKQAEAAMRQHEKVIETAIDGFWMTDMMGTLLEVNRAYAEISGYSMEELVGMHISQLEAIEHPEDTRQHIEAVMTEGHDRFETRHRRKDGRIVDIEVSVTYLAGHERMFVFCRDISQRKRDELDRQIASVAFETQDAIVITDAEANIVRVNHAFELITGYTAADVIGKNPRIMSSGRHDKAFYETMWNSLKEEGAWSGEIWDRRKNGQIYPRWMTITAVRNDKREISHYVGIFSDITERKRIEEEIRGMAFYDALTSLPNRRLLLERMRAALAASVRSGQYGAVLFLDMDRFKLLNDTLGHEYGDMMLVEVAHRIKSCVREVDTVARLGGDEFVVLIEETGFDEMEAQERSGTVAEKIRHALAQPYQLRDQKHLSSPSIGVVLYLGDSVPPDALLRKSDLAMYGAKKCGRNAVCFFNAGMEQDEGECRGDS